jgi:L-rhamnose mutarotase
MKRYALALDLKDNDKLISEYEEHHQRVWPEVKESIFGSGIINMEIYRLGTRLFMLMETEDDFSFEKKSEADRNNPKVVEWETLMSVYQQVLPLAKPGEKWLVMDKIFKLTKK